VRKRIGRCKRGERQCRADGLLKPACIAKRANEAVMRFNVLRGHGACLRLSECDGLTKCFCSFGGRSVSEQVHAALAEFFDTG